MIEFSIKIINFNIESSVFEVEFIPVDTTLTSLIQHIFIDLLHLPEPNQENIVAYLTKNSPQSYWENQIKMRDIIPLALSLNETMANLIIHPEITTPIYQNHLEEIKATSPQPMDTAEVDEFISNILGKIEGNT